MHLIVIIYACETVRNSLKKTFLHNFCYFVAASPCLQSRSQRSQWDGFTSVRPQPITWERRANRTLTRGDTHAITSPSPTCDSLWWSYPLLTCLFFFFFGHGRYFMLVVALHAQSHSQSYTVAAHVSERIIVRVTSGHVCLPPTTIISLVNVTLFS